MTNKTQSSFAHFASFLSQNKAYFFLALAIIFSISSHSMVFDEFIMPTYGNTMIHAASIRHMLVHGEYPSIDYSYGGGIANYYVPVYRVLIAKAVLLTGLSVDLVSRLMVMLFAIVLPVGFFALGRKLFGNSAGVLAAFLCILPGELLIYSVRPLPQSLGMVLLPIAFLALLSQNRKAAFLMAFAVLMSHQEAALFFAACAAAYYAVAPFFEEKKAVKVSLILFAFTVVAYLLWHFSVTGTFNIFELAQFKNHEGATVSYDSFMDKTGTAVVYLSIAGLLIVLYRLLSMAFLAVKELARHPNLSEGIVFSLLMVISASAAAFLITDGTLSGISSSGIFISLAAAVLCAMLAKHASQSPSLSSVPAFHYIFLFAITLAGVALVKNDVIGLRVFMDRFLVYLHEPMILLAALGCSGIASLIAREKKKLF